MTGITQKDWKWLAVVRNGFLSGKLLFLLFFYEFWGLSLSTLCMIFLRISYKKKSLSDFFQHSFFSLNLSLSQFSLPTPKLPPHTPPPKIKIKTSINYFH